MKIPIYRWILLLTAIAFPLYAQQTFPLVGPRPSQVGDEKIVKSPDQGYLRVYTPEIPLYDEDGFIGWDNDNYRIIPESGGRARTWFDRRPLALNPGTYDVELVSPGVDAVEPHDQNDYGRIRVVIRPNRITEVWLNDTDRPRFANPRSPVFTRYAYGDVVGYRLGAQARVARHALFEGAASFRRTDSQPLLAVVQN